MGGASHAVHPAISTPTGNPLTSTYRTQLRATNSKGKSYLIGHS